MYDANVGRWLSRDPKRQYYSPYIGIMGNNPVLNSDPDGGSPEDEVHFNTTTGDITYVKDDRGFS
jgi:hypothetical protein